MDHHRRRVRVTGRLAARICAAVALLSALALLGAACTPARPFVKKVEPRRVVGKTDFGIAAEFFDYDPVEIAVLAPEGDITPAFRKNLREALYGALLDKNYSPLDPAYVDARQADVKDESASFFVRNAVTAIRRTPDGGLLMSGWAALMAPKAYGGQCIYQMELIDFAVPPGPGTLENQGAPEAANRFAESLFSRLPGR